MTPDERDEIISTLRGLLVADLAAILKEETREQKLEGLLRSALTGLELLHDVTDTQSLLPGLQRVIGEIKKELRL